MHCATPHQRLLGLNPIVFMTGRRWRHEGPFGHGPGPGAMGGRGPRRSRGDIRAAILALLSEGPKHGYQIITELSERTDGAWRPSPGSVYPTLQALADEGLIKGMDEDGGRRLYELTADGAAPAAEAAASPAWEAAARESADEDGPHAMRKLAFSVGMAAMQVAQAGDASQTERARAILADTRRELYRILADEGSQTTK